MEELEKRIAELDAQLKRLYEIMDNDKFTIGASHE